MFIYRERDRAGVGLGVELLTVKKENRWKIKNW